LRSNTTLSPTSSTAILQYIRTISDSNKNTGYEYLKRLEDFETFVKSKYHFTIDEITINKVFDPNIYELLNSYVSYLVNATNKDGYKISNLTLKQRVITAKNFLEYHDIEISPRRFKLKVKFPKVVRKHKEALSKEDIIKFLESCTAIKLKTYLLFLAATGCRASEACSVRLMDINFNKNTVDIRGEYTKTKQDRKVFLTNELVDQLKLWINYKYRERRRYLEHDRKNIRLIPKRNDHDLVFSSSFLFNGKPKLKKDEYETVNRIYSTLVHDFDKVSNRLGISYEDSTKRRRKITPHSFRRYVKSVISDLGYSDYSEWFIGHIGSTYYRKSDKEKYELFKKIEPYLTYLDQSGLERRGADLQNRLETMEHENKDLRENINKIMEMIQQNPSLANVKPEVLAKKIR